LSACSVLRLFARPENVAVFWPAAGVASGILIALGPRRRFSMAAAVFVATAIANLLRGGRPRGPPRGFWWAAAWCVATAIPNLLSGGDASGALVFAVANTVEPLIIAYAL